MGKFFGQIISIHITVARDEQLGTVGLHQLQIARPFVFDPYSAVILRFCADNKHNFGGVECGEYVRLIFLTKFILKGNGSIKDLEALLSKLIINIVGYRTVNSPFAVFICFLVAYKNVKRLFILHDGKYIFLYAVNGSCFGFIKRLLCRIGIINGSKIIRISSYCIEKRTVTGWDTLKSFRVLNVFDAVFTKNDTPVSFCFTVILLNDFFVDLFRLIKFTF